jgi:hypothetical protein
MLVVAHASLTNTHLAHRTHAHTHVQANAYIKQLLKQQGGSLEKVKEVLATYEKSIGSGGGSGSGSSASGDDGDDAGSEREKANVRELMARLSAS